MFFGKTDLTKRRMAIDLLTLLHICTMCAFQLSLLSICTPRKLIYFFPLVQYY